MRIIGMALSVDFLVPMDGLAICRTPSLSRFASVTRFRDLLCMSRFHFPEATR